MKCYLNLSVFAILFSHAITFSDEHTSHIKEVNRYQIKVVNKSSQLVNVEVGVHSPAIPYTAYAKIKTGTVPAHETLSLSMPYFGKQLSPLIYIGTSTFFKDTGEQGMYDGELYLDVANEYEVIHSDDKIEVTRTTPEGHFTIKN